MANFAKKNEKILYGTLIGMILIKQLKIDATNVNSDQKLSELPGDLADLQKIVRSLVSGDISINDVQNNDTYKEVTKTIDSYEESKKTSKTALLWLKYIHSVEVYLRFLKAERTSNWALHLQAAREMMPYFAASGHYLYAKSTYLYLQTMHKLPSTNPDVHKRF